MRQPFPPTSKRNPRLLLTPELALRSAKAAGLIARGDTVSGAIFDRSGKFRYALWRVWEKTQPHICFVLLNPSTADHRRNDPTITRCLKFARRFQFGAVNIVNLFALRSTDSSRLYKVRDPIGSHNDRFIELALNASDVIVFAWGNHGLLADRHSSVRASLGEKRTSYCFGLTKQGQPRHPLYLRADADLMPFLPE